QGLGRRSRLYLRRRAARTLRSRGLRRRERGAEVGGRQVAGRRAEEAVALRIGTRASALALAQSRMVADLLGGAELVEITTSGDRVRAAGDKSRFVKEIDDALLAGEVDLAVHSAKDVPGVLPDGLEIAAVPARADPRDVLCGAASLDALPPGARVGTASIRRRSQLLALREDLEIVELRGNVDTRLRKLEEEDYDAIVLAAAGLQRLGTPREGVAPLQVGDMIPAPG